MVKKNQIRLRHITQALLFILIIVFSALAIAPLKRYTVRKISFLKENIINEIEKNSGYYIEYGTISPSFLTALKIDDIRIFESENVRNVKPILHINQVRVNYNPMVLFAQRKSPHISDIIFSITLDSPSLEYEAVSDFAAGGNSGINIDFLQSLTTSITIKNGSFKLTQNEYILEIRKIKMVLNNNPDQIGFKSSADLSLKLKGESYPFNQLDLKLDMDGLGSNDWQNIQLKTSIKNLASELFMVKDQEIEINYNNDIVEISKIQDTVPLNLLMKFNPENKSMYFNFEMLDFKLEDIIGFKQGLSEYNYILEMPLSGKGEVNYNLPYNSVLYSYDGNITINHPSFPEKISIDTELSGNSESILFTDLNAEIGDRGIVSYNGLFNFRELNPSGILSSNKFVINENVTVSGRFILEKLGNFYTVNSTDCRFSGIEFRHASLVLNADSDIYTASLSLGQSTGSEINSHIAFFPPGSDNYSGNIQGELSISKLYVKQFKPFIEDIISPEITKRFPETGFLSLDAVFQSDIDNSDFSELTLADFTSHYKARIKEFRFIVPEIVEIKGNSQINQDYFYIVTEPAQLNNHSFSLDCQGERVESHWNLLTKITHNQNEYDLQINQLGNRRYSLKGSYGVKGNLLINSDNDFFANLAMSDLPVDLTDGMLYLGGTSELSVSSKHWQLNFQDMEVALSGNSQISDSSVLLTASLDSESLDIMNLEYTDSLNTLGGAGRLNYKLAEQHFQGWLNLSGNQKRENINVVFNINPDLLKTRIVMNNILLNRIPGDDLSGRLSAEINTSGTFDSPVAKGTLKSHNLFYKGTPLQISTAFDLNKELWRLYGIDLQWQNQKIENGIILADFLNSRLSSSASYNGMLGENKLSGAFSLVSGFAVDDILANPKSLIDSEFEATVLFDDLLWNGYAVYPESRFQLTRKSNFWELKGNDQFVAGYQEKTGDFSINTLDLLPLEVKAGGRLENNYIDMEVSYLDLDLSIINYIMPKDPFISQHYALFRDGHLKGSLSVQGKLDNPMVYGILYARDILVDTPYIYNEIDRTNIDIQISGNKIVAQEFDINTGEGRISASGYIDFSNGGIDEYHLDVKARARDTVARARGVPIYYPLPGIVLDGLFTGNLVIDGDSEKGGLKADFNFPFLESSIGEVKPANFGTTDSYITYPFDVDINFITGNDNTFYLPSKEIAVLEAKVTPGQSLNLHYAGESGFFTFLGILSMKTGEIFYFDRNFSLTEGSILFDETGDNFNPEIFARAEFNTNNSEGDSVTVSLVLDNGVLEDFIPHFDSEPAMSEGEILALFGESLIPFSNTEVSWEEVVSSVGTTLVDNTSLLSPIEEQLKTSFNLDMVSIKTDIIGNVLLYGISENQNRVESGNNQIARILSDNTSINMGKYIGKNLFFTSGLFINAANTDTIAGNMAIRPSFGLELKLPFMTVDWTYDKKDNDNYFTNDNSLSLKWQYSF